VVALQSFKELKSWNFSFEKNHPPWGLCSGIQLPKGCRISATSPLSEADDALRFDI
jgi:hypothetical protein